MPACHARATSIQESRWKSKSWPHELPRANKTPDASKGRHPARKGRRGCGRQGTSRRVCVVDAVTADSVKGMANVLPLYQDGNWSRKYGLSGSPDSPITMFSVDPSTLLQSTVRRWLAPSSPRTWLSVVSSPHSWCGPVLDQLRKKGSIPYRGCCTSITCWLPYVQPRSDD